MNIILTLFLLLLLVIQLILIVCTVKAKKLSIKYATFWIILIIIMVFVVIFPNTIINMAKLFGFEASSNMIFLLGFFFLFYTIFILTTSISILNEKIKQLIQEVSILKERVDKNGRKD